MAEKLRSSDQIKVFILYLLDKIGYPLEYTDIATIIIRDGLVDYFDFVEHFHQLLMAGHIAKLPKNGSDAVAADAAEEDEGRIDWLFEVTDTGRTIAKGLADDLLMTAVREKSYISAMRHLSLERRKAVITQSSEQEGTGYIFHCSINDMDGLALNLSIRADSYNQLSRMKQNFEERPDVVYRGIIALVTGNVNYLFDT
ncbi:MAG: DUF4364 family protein [Ruminococcaceae bacterium]|nr:DUF4364 family protein [Oscillospiraceae bacterium]